MSSDEPWEQLSKADQQRRINAARAVSAQRRNPALSLTAAAKAEGITPKTVLRYFGAYYSRDSTGALRPGPSDKERFLMPVYSTRGIVDAVAADSHQRSLVGQHTAAVTLYGDTGRTSQLATFDGARVGDAELETNPDRLMALLIRDRIDFLDIYTP